MKRIPPAFVDLAASASRPLLGCLASLLIACGAHADDVDRLRGLIEPLVAKQSFRIGATLVHLQDNFWKGMAYGIVDEAQRSNVEVVQVLVAGAYGNVREQFAQIETLQSRGADFVVVGPAAYNGFDPILKELREHGIGIIAAGIPLNSANVDFGVAEDDRAIGAAQAKLVCEAKKTPAETALLLQGPIGAEWAALRLEGFADTAKDCTGLDLVQGPPTQSLDLQQGLTEASDLMLKHPDATIIETPAISLGMGAVQATRQLGRPDVRIVTSGIVREVIPMLEDGRILAVSSEPSVIMGRLIVQYAIRQHDHLPMPNLVQAPGLPYPALILPTVMVTGANAGGYRLDVYDLPPPDWSLSAAP